MKWIFLSLLMTVLPAQQYTESACILLKPQPHMQEFSGVFRSFQEFSGVFRSFQEFSVMELNPKEVVLVKAAIKSRNKSKLFQPILFAFLVAALLGMLFGSLSGEEFIYLAIPLVLVTILLPQFGNSPKYNELVDILEKQLHQHPTMEDVLSQELKKQANKSR